MRRLTTTCATALALLSTHIDALAQEPATPLEGQWVIEATQSGDTSIELFWTDGTNWKRRVATSALGDLPAGELEAGRATPVSFTIASDAGTFELAGSFENGRGRGNFIFTPHRAFGAALASAGVREIDDLSDHDLKNLAWGDISAGDVRAFLALGFAPLTLDRLIDLAIFQVTPEYAAGLAELGYHGLGADVLIDLRRAGVNAELVRRVHQAGYRGVTPEILIRMKRHGIEETARRYGLTGARVRI